MGIPSKSTGRASHTLANRWPVVLSMLPTFQRQQVPGGNVGGFAVAMLVRVHQINQAL
jgi:hypothetical protein